MDESNRKEFVTALVGLGEMYSKTLSGALIEMYWQALRRYEYQAVSAAVQRHYSDPEKGAFFPKPGDIILWIDGGMEDRSQIAWSKVTKAIRTVGPYQSVCFDDPVIHAVIEQMGGWPSLCNQPSDDELKFAGHRFVKLYRANRSTTEFPAKLTGISDAENSLRGRKSSTPVLIGDAGKAEQVLLGGSSQSRIGITRTTHAQIEQLINRAPKNLINEVA